MDTKKRRITRSQTQKAKITVATTADIITLLYLSMLDICSDDEKARNWFNMIRTSKLWHKIGTRQIIKERIAIITVFHDRSISFHDSDRHIGCSCEWKRNNTAQIKIGTLRTYRFASKLTLEVQAQDVAKNVFTYHMDGQSMDRDAPNQYVRVWNGGCDVALLAFGKPLESNQIKSYFPL